MRTYPVCFLITIFLSIFTTKIHAQTGITWGCADQQLTQLQKESQPLYAEVERKNNLLLKEYINNILKNRIKSLEQNRAGTTGDSGFVIPVVVHVIYPTGEAYGTGTNISYSQIRSQLDGLNAAFNKNYPLYNGQTHPDYASNTHIRFCLARSTSDLSSWAVGPGGIEYGVKRYANSTQAYNHAINIPSANQILDITHPNPNSFPFDKYLNIWLVKTIGGGNNVMGYAPRPLMSSYPLDGVIMRADVFGDNTTGGNYLLNSFGLNQGKVLAHEIGHYFNLNHIFQGDCSGANAPGSAIDACDLNGDMICDIEPATTQNIECSANIPNTCTANYATGTTTLDMINDYMSYADDDCMNTFTSDQAKRMWATLNLQRFNLWQPENLVATGVLGGNGCIPPYLNAQINTNGASFCAKKPMLFSNPTAGNTANSYSWEFPGSNVSFANTNPVSVTYNNSGNYIAILRVSDGVNTRKDSILFTILDCKLDSSMLHMSHWYFGNFGAIDFSFGTPIPTKTALDNKTMKGESAFPTQLASVAATVSLSDSLGNLLFYSNAVSVWNKNHQKISTVSIFGSSDINRSSGVSYIPYPGKPNRYFIVGASANLSSVPEGAKYVEVNLENNTVGSFKEFQHPTLPAKLSQFLTVVPHCNGTDYWIITHGYGTDTRFYSFLVTSAGINNLQAPIISQGTHEAYQGSGNQLKANISGDKLVLATPHGTDNRAAALYDFDGSTGGITNEKIVENVHSYSNIQTGTAFSPNGEFFYLMRSSNFQTNGLPYWLFQYRVSDLKYQVFAAPGFYFAASFEPGPDNQIYITTQDHFLARLSNPDEWGGASVNGFFINMRKLSDSIRPSVSIPAFIDAKKPRPTKPQFSVEKITCTRYRFKSFCYEGYTAYWNFGDGSGVETGNSVTHNFMQPGLFDVTLSLQIGTGIVGSVSKKISVAPITGSISGPLNVCTNYNYPSQYSSPLLQGVNYKWTLTNGIFSGPDNISSVNVIWLPAASTGNIKLTISRDSCSLVISKNIDITRGPNFSWIFKDSVCILDSSFVITASPGGGYFEGRGVRNNRFYPSEAGLGKHLVTYSYVDETTCFGLIQKNIKVAECNTPPDQSSDCNEILKHIEIAPNPVKNILKLKSDYILSFVQVFNSSGQKIIEGPLKNNTLPIPLLAGGLYVVRIFCEDYTSYRSLKFIKFN